MSTTLLHTDTEAAYQLESQLSRGYQRINNAHLATSRSHSIYMDRGDH